MVAPMASFSPSSWKGYPITVFQAFTSGGAGAAETFTLNANYPKFDLTKNHPVIAFKYVSIATSNTIHESEQAMNYSVNELARSTAADQAARFDIESNASLKLWKEYNHDGIIFISYWASSSQLI